MKHAVHAAETIKHNDAFSPCVFRKYIFAPFAKANIGRRMLVTKKKRKNPQPYDTYALAECAYRDQKTNAARPSDETAERMRHWSIENKL